MVDRIATALVPSAHFNRALTVPAAEIAPWSFARGFVRSWRRVALLKADRLDPDMLDERARQLLDYADPRDVTVLISRRDWPASGRKRAPLIGR